MPAPGIEVICSMEWTIGGAPGIDMSGSACVCEVDIVATRTDSTHLRVTFARPVRLTPWLTALANWSVRDSLGVAPVLTVRSISAENVAAPTYVDLLTDEQRTGINYIVEAYTLEAA